LLRLALIAPETRKAHCGAEFALLTISDNTNSTVATNGRSLHTRQC
jgi:hypothetical protein